MIFRLFSYLESNKIDFCLINGYQELFSNVRTDSDIDILFKKKDFVLIEQILKQFCINQGLIIVQSYHQEVFAKNMFLFDTQSGEFLNLDIYGELSRNKTVLFREPEIFQTLDRYKNIPILSAEKEFTNYLIKKLDKNDLTNTNFENLRLLFLKKENACKKAIIKYFTTQNTIIIDAFSNNNYVKLSDASKNLIRDFQGEKTGGLVLKIKDKIRVLKRIIRPTGLSIGFLGPDGSGKSTVIDKLVNNNLPFRRTDYFHLKPIKQVQSSTTSITTDPHKYKPYSKPKSYVKLLLFIYQYNIGWIKNIVPIKVKSSLIIFDRYFDDLLIDSVRYRYGGSISFAKFVRRIIPKPDLYFILTADPEVIFKRKQEVSFEELTRQAEAYNALSDNVRYFQIDVNRNPEEITEEVIHIMMQKMNERY